MRVLRFLIIAATLASVAFIFGCQTPKSQMTGFWVKCPDAEATHAVSVHCDFQDEPPFSYTWFFKQAPQAKSSPQPLAISASAIHLTLSPTTLVKLTNPNSKCDATFSLSEPRAEFPSSPFLLNFHLSWQTKGKSEQFSKIIEVRGPLSTEFPEQKLKITVSMTELRRL
jgi:hypothetical protein